MYGDKQTYTCGSWSVSVSCKLLWVCDIKLKESDFHKLSISTLPSALLIKSHHAEPSIHGSSDPEEKLFIPQKGTLD